MRNKNGGCVIYHSDLFGVKTGTHAMLCSGLEPKAVHLFEEVGIDVFGFESVAVLEVN